MTSPFPEDWTTHPGDASFEYRRKGAVVEFRAKRKDAPAHTMAGRNVFRRNPSVVTYCTCGLSFYGRTAALSEAAFRYHAETAK